MRRILMLALVTGPLAAAGWLLLGGGPPSEADMIARLTEHRAALTEVGDALLAEGAEAAIDLRPSPMPIPVPPRLADAAATLRTTPVTLAARDGSLNGVVFLLSESGIAISGTSTGLLYTPGGRTLPTGTVATDDLRGALARAVRNSGKRAVKALFVQPIDRVWALYLETY